MQTEPQVSILRQIPRSVWVLGCVSLFMDVSSEIIHSLLPMFLMASLGASATTIGLIEGIAKEIITGLWLNGNIPIDVLRL